MPTSTEEALFNLCAPAEAGLEYRVEERQTTCLYCRQRQAVPPREFAMHSRACPIVQGRLTLHLPINGLLESELARARVHYRERDVLGEAAGDA